MQTCRVQTENRNVANLRATPEAKARPGYCFNHQDKPATHSLLPQGAPHPLLYCEKCAIMLASKGHNINKLQSSSRPTPLRPQLPSLRQRQIEHFLSELAAQVGDL